MLQLFDAKTLRLQLSLSFVRADDFSAKMEDTENIRRADFVDSLLKSDCSQPIAQLEPDTREVKYDSHPQTLESSFPTRLNNQEQAESDFLKKELEKKMKLPKYMEMLKARASLPIARIKTSFLQKLNENDAIVVCGETGCGKTTQLKKMDLSLEEKREKMLQIFNESQDFFLVKLMNSQSF